MAKILLVEDNEDNRDMLSRRLLRRGYEVVMAVDGQAGVDMATPGPYRALAARMNHLLDEIEALQAKK